MGKFSLKLVRLGSPFLEKVWELYRRNTKKLGFLPRGALDEFSHANCVLAAIQNEILVGYVAWRRSRDEAVLVHLCVSEEYRGSGCAEVLLRGLVDHCESDAAIRLRCRKDYAAANKLWPKYNFAVEHEIVGRGADAVPLLVWRRIHRESAPLLEAINAAKSRASRVVAVDANVFFDLMNQDAVNHEESSALLADWLDDVGVCVTRELRNEVSRQESAVARQKALSFFQGFQEISGRPDEVDLALSQLEGILPRPLKESDHSDRRQLAHAWIARADFFATRDKCLLDHADSLLKLTGLEIMRPGDIVARLHGNLMGNGYAPARLHGTSIERRTVVTESDLLPFQNFSDYESKASWLAVIRGARSAPERYSFELVGPKGEAALVALCLDNGSPDTLKIHFLRELSNQLTPTLLRRMLANIIEGAQVSSRTSVLIEDLGSDQVRMALVDLGFVDVLSSGMSRYILALLGSYDECLGIIGDKFPELTLIKNVSAENLEADFWPMKINNAEIPSYIVPIKPYWASALFDKNLAAQGLFDVPERVALALENVYYSGSRVLIPKNGRIIWYVSGEIQEVRAVSACLGTEVGTASNLSRKHHRLGAYQWRDVLDAAGGRPDANLHAYMFARTELLKNSVPWDLLKKLIYKHTRTRNTLPSPVRIPESLFNELYSLGVGKSS